MLKLWIYFTFICMSKAAFGEQFSDVSNEYFDYYSSNVADNSYEDNEKSPYTSGDDFFLDSLKTTHLIDEDLTTPELKNELINFDTNENNDFKTELDSKQREDSIKTERGDEDFSANESNNIGINIGKKLRVLDYQIEDNRSDENDSKNEYDSQGFSDRKDSLNLSDINDADMKTLSDEIENEMNGEFSENNSGEKSNNKEMIKKILDDTKFVLSEDTGNDFAEDVLIKDQANKNITTAYKTIIDETKTILEETQGDLDEQSSIENVEVTNKSTSNNEKNKYKDDDFIADLVELNNIKNELSDFDVDSNNSQNQNNDFFNSQENDDNDYENIIDTNLEQIFVDQEAAKNEDVIIHKVEPLSDYPLSFEADDIDINQLETEKSSTGTSKDSLVTSTSSTEFESEEVARASESYIDTKNMTESQIDKLLIDFTGKNLENIVSSAKSSNNPERVWLSVDEPTVITSPGYPNPYPTNSITDWIFEGTGTGIEFNVTDCDINGHVGDYLLVKPGDVDDSGRNGLIFTYNLNTERRYRFIDVDRMFMRFQANMGMPFMRGFKISARMLVHAPIIREPEPESEPSIQYPEHTLTLNLGGISLEGFIEVEEQFRQIIADMATMYINANNISTEVNNTLEVTQITSKALCFHNWPGYEMCAEVQFGVPLFFEEGKRPRLDEKDLHDMWLQYFNQDPFAVRLRMLGITEFQVPNDNGVIVVWLVIAAGVVISMMMLAFALWRYSCFEDYSRMPMHSDTDSLADKRRLDMFPTPHQTLPPLYTDADYKWVDNDEPCKVDIGGYSNRNFLADDMFDVDSEDEIVPGRNRDHAIRPRDIYSV